MPDRIQNNPFNRPPRLQNGFLPVDIDIPSPPVPPDDTARNLLLSLLPMSSFVIMGLFYSISFSGGTGMGWLYALPMIGMAVFFFIISFVTFGEQKQEQKHRWLKQLRDYHRLLDKKESRLLAGRVLQANWLALRYQRPTEIIQRVKNLDITLWERRPEDADFATYRLGLGDWPSVINIKAPDPDINSPEIRRAYNLYTEYNKVPNSPVSLDLRQIGSVAFVGNRDHTIPLLRALVTQIAVLNSPDDLHLFMFSSEPYYKIWKWLRWLPHTSANHVGGDPTFLAFQANTNKELIAGISQTLDIEKQEDEKNQTGKSKLSQAMLLIFDKETEVRDEPIFSQLMKEGKRLGVYSIILCDKMEDVPSDCAAVVEVGATEFKLALTGPQAIKMRGKPDKLRLMEADTLSHRLLPIAIQTMGKTSRIPSRVNLLQLYGVGKLENLEVANRWKQKPTDDGLLPFPVPIGGETYASPLMIDLAENRDGPHGLIAGTTGSGKSELLQTLVSSLALEHHPYFVNFLLIDFKGASTFGVFEKMPHVVGLVSNLDKLSANRALEAINTESIRRQTFLRDIKKEDISEYYQMLADPESSRNLEPLPHLFIIVDEFAQMAQEMPGFLSRLVDTARLGRSLGVHLILATQRPAGVVNDQMRANLNFRICLRVQSIDDSRDMLRRPDAAFLPHNLPGRAYFQVGDGGMLRQFQVARAGVEYEPEKDENKKNNYLYKVNYEQASLVEDLQEEKNRKRNKISIAGQLALDLASLYEIEINASLSKKMEPILLPPLEAKEDLLMILQDCAWSGKKKTWTEHPNQTHGFKVPVGRLDSLATHTQPPLVIDFTEYGGHVMAVGGPQSGKTYFLESLCYSLAVNYNPSQVNIYVLSFAGKGLDHLKKLPHVGAVIEGNETERVHRLLRYLLNQIESRKEAFSEYGAKDLQNYNDQVKPEERLPSLCILIDNFGELRNLEYDNELSEIEKLINTGRSYGVYFVLTALQSNDIPYKISNLIQRRLAFNLSDHTEYLLLVGRPDSLEFDVLPSGRCFVSGTTPPLQGQIGYPPIQKEWDALTSAMISAWGDRPLPRAIEILEKNTYLSTLLGHDKKDVRGLKNVIGIDGDTLDSFEMDWYKHGPHFLVGGPSQSGRTSLLHTVVLSLTNKYSPEQLNIVLMDGTNSSLVSLEDLPHVIERVIEEDGLSRNIAHLQNELNERKKDMLSNKKSQADRSEILFVIDDYDLTCEALAINEFVLSKLGKHIRQDSDLGFHFLISVLPENLSGSTDPLIKQLRLARSGISLSNIDTLEMLGARPSSAMRNEELTQGRGYLFSRLGIKLIQFANPDKSAYQSVLRKWSSKSNKAEWARPANQQQIDQVRSDSAPVLNAETSIKGLSKPVGGYINQDEALKRYMQQRQMQAKKGIS